MADADLFPKEFIDRVKEQMPAARANLELAERRLEVAKAAGADIKVRQKHLFEVRESLRKIRTALGIA